MPMHALQDLPFTSVVPGRPGALPDVATLKRQIALAALAHCELTEQALGVYTPPKEVREVQLTYAATDQIRTMWQGLRQAGSTAPPTIPLKVFVTGFGQDSNGDTWADIEVHPGLPEWAGLA
ncbi:MAG: hypothetical protein KF892_06945 [Rhizobacter sp.]|nr:hypothetical protein [Rhizobacter sp.]